LHQASLDHRAEVVSHRPVFDDATAGQPEPVRMVNVHALDSRCRASGVIAGHPNPRHDLIAFSHQVLNLGMEVR
jgi:hypothetical protein